MIIKKEHNTPGQEIQNTAETASIQSYSGLYPGYSRALGVSVKQ
jgi:hypothetical protein